MSTNIIKATSKIKLSSHLNIPFRIPFRSLCFSEISFTSKKSKSSEIIPEVKPFKDNERDVWIGPPDPISNLRLKVYPQSQDLSEDEKIFYSKSKEIQDWNQHYWAAHNTDFMESRKMYINKVSKEKNLSNEETLSAEEMSIFYKEFLNRNRIKHITYNWNWYMKNVGLIFLAAKVNLNKFKKTIINSAKLKS